MQKKIADQISLFALTFKWFLLATVLGAVVGAATTLFLKALDMALAWSRARHDYFFALPAVLYLTALISRRFFPKADVESTDKAIEYIHQLKSIHPVSILKSFFLPILTIGAGGSAGKEAPAADIGAGLGSLLSEIFRFNAEDRRKMTICGVSAGFAAVFGTPLAGALFGLEVLSVGNLLYDALLPSFVAGITANHVAVTLGAKAIFTPLRNIPVFNEIFLLKVAAAGVFFGLCSLLLIKAMRMMRSIAEKFERKYWLVNLGAGFSLIVFSLIFSTRYLGLGMDSIVDAVNGSVFPWYAFLIKILTTTITLNGGGCGGIVTPIFFIGATSGTWFAHLLGVDSSTFAALGLVSLLAGAANTPLSASIMAMELFGAQIAPYAAIASIISFLVKGQRSIYPSQIIGIKKSKQE